MPLYHNFSVPVRRGKVAWAREMRPRLGAAPPNSIVWRTILRYKWRQVAPWQKSGPHPTSLPIPLNGWYERGNGQAVSLILDAPNASFVGKR